MDTYPTEGCDCQMCQNARQAEEDRKAIKALTKEMAETRKAIEELKRVVEEIIGSGGGKPCA